MYNLIKCSHNYSKPSGSSWNHFKEEPLLNDNGADFPADNKNSLNFKQK